MLYLQGSNWQLTSRSLFHAAQLTFSASHPKNRVKEREKKREKEREKKTDSEEPTFLTSFLYIRRLSH